MTCSSSTRATRISADARILEGAVEVDLSAINGESVPVVREYGPGTTATRVVDAADVVLSGTTCTGGEAQALVVHTGMLTELGRIARLSHRTGQDPSPLERQVRRAAWLIAAVSVTLGVAFMPVGARWPR